jgi:hypothetical protein
MKFPAGVKLTERPVFYARILDLKNDSYLEYILNKTLRADINVT